MPHCSWCSYRITGQASPEDGGPRFFCSPSHRSAWLRDHPPACDCGCGALWPQIREGGQRFARVECLAGFHGRSAAAARS